MKVDYIRRRGGDLAVLEPEIAMVAQVQSRDSFVISRKHSRSRFHSMLLEFKRFLRGRTIAFGRP